MDKSKEEEAVISKAKQYGDSYTENNEARIAAKGYASGYLDALAEKNKEIKEMAGIVKLLLPGISLVPAENIKVIEEYIKRKEA